MSKIIYDPGARLIETFFSPTTCFCYFVVLYNCFCCACESCSLSSYRYLSVLQFVFASLFLPSIVSVFTSCSCCVSEPWWTDSYGHLTVLQHLHDEYAVTDHRTHWSDAGLPHTPLQPHPRPGILRPEWNNRLAPLSFVSLNIHTKWGTIWREPFFSELIYCKHISLGNNRISAPFVLLLVQGGHGHF